MRALLLSAVAAVIGLVVASASEPGLALSDAVGFRGVGRIRVGMSLGEVQQAASEPVTLDEDSATQDEAATPDACVFATLPGYRWGISWMLIDGRVARTDVTERGFATVSGVKVGDPEKSVLSSYRGRVKIERHTYREGGHYMTVESSDHKSAVVFETDGSTVTGYRIGRLPEALYIEGCQ